MKKCFLIFLLICFLSSGCGSIPGFNGEYTVTPIPITLTSSSIPTEHTPPNLTVPTATEVLKHTSTIPVSLYNKKCIDISASTISDLALPGTIILTSPTNSGEKVFLNLRTGEYKPFSQQNGYLAYGFKVSPNGEWIAYRGSKKSTDGDDSLVVQSVNGEKTNTYLIDYSEWQSIAYWINDETLVLWNHGSPLDNVILFNPFTEQKIVMHTNYPDVISNDEGWDFSWPSVTIFDPTLRYLIYLGNSEDGYRFGYQRLILWDKENSRRIAEVNNFGHTTVRPLWKSDSSGVVFVKSKEGYDPPKKQDEWYFWGVDGKLKQLTNLSKYFQKEEIYSNNWSPDEHFLAFLLTSNLGGTKWDRRLLILNMDTLEISDYCFAPEQFSPLVWSPDSRYLAFSELLADDTSRTVLVDMVDRSAVVIAENSSPVVWLNSIR